MTSTEHPVEEGISLSDHTRRNPIEINLTGKIVGSNWKNVLDKLNAYKNKGTLITFTGRTTLKNAQIMNIDDSYDSSISDGCNYSMTIREVRIAQSAYVSSKAKTGSAVATAVIKSGSKIALSSEPLYAASSSKSAVRSISGTYYIYDAKVMNGRIRITNSASRVGKTPAGSNVTGWISSKSRGLNTSTKSNAGMQQVENNSSSSKVYHTVKRGDTVYALVASAKAPYKKYGFTCKDVMQKNPNAFSRANDYGSLKVGAKLWVGNR
ncbi:MAG: hypothetical protein NC110_05270 [Ruminococcus sp.]|nr:hypothetical protein [Ruminococcus sp.]